MIFDARRDPMGSAPALRKPVHQVQECPSRGSRGRVRLHGPQFRHHLVVHCDLDARARVSLDSADQCRQSLASLTDREFHGHLQVNMYKMYNLVQEMSTGG